MIDNLYQTMSEFLSSDQNVEEVDNDDDEELPILVTIPDSDKKVPVTILTGFLGSGKTTLLNYILSANHGKKIAVIENEFSGGLGIEGMIAKSGLDGGDLNGFFELNNGCICCTVKEDLLTTLEQLVMHKDRFDYIIIETTGVANPGPVITTFWSDDAIESSLKLDGVVCVVDSLNIQSYLQTEDIANDVRMQLSYADRILMNKSDLVSTENMGAIREEIKSINSIAAVVETSYANISTNWVLDINCYSTNMPDPNLEFDMKQGLITGKMCVPCDPLKRKSESNYHAKKMKNGDENNVLNSSKHSASSLSTCSISFPGLLDVKKVNSFLDEILFSNGARVGGGYRQPNISYIDLSKKESPIENFPSKDDVVVYTSAPQLIPVVNKSNHSNINDNDMKIFRIKGILHVNSQEYVQLLQAVFDIFEIKSSSFLIGSNEDMSLGLNRIVVIGRNIDKDEIEEGFLSCLL